MVDSLLKRKFMIVDEVLCYNGYILIIVIIGLSIHLGKENNYDDDSDYC